MWTVLRCLFRRRRPTDGLSEIKNARQVSGEPFRRWFSGTAGDLIVWYSDADAIAAFQLCYDKGTAERALTWREEHGFTHRRVDDGEAGPGGHKMTPVLVPDGTLDQERIRQWFTDQSHHVDPTVVEFVQQKLAEFPGWEGHGMDAANSSSAGTSSE